MVNSPTDATRPDGTAEQKSAGLVFVVDDQSMIRKLAAIALGNNGFEVEEAASAPEALRRFEKLAPRLVAVIVDKNLDGACGVELLAIFRETLPELPALLISGELLADDGDFDDRTLVVAKPFRLHELCAALGQVIGSRAP